MNILLTPQEGGRKMTYDFHDDVIKADNGEKVTFFDCRQVQEGKSYTTTEPLISVERRGGELYATLLNPISDNATAEEKFPQWHTAVESDFEMNGEVIYPQEDKLIPGDDDLITAQFEALKAETEELKDLIQEMALVAYDH